MELPLPDVHVVLEQRSSCYEAHPVFSRRARYKRGFLGALKLLARYPGTDRGYPSVAARWSTARKPDEVRHAD